MATMATKKRGVLLGQIGTPEAPMPAATRSYLRRFLSDRRVIDLNPFFWKLILHLFVLRTRPAQSARMYEEIWMPEGSPLRVYSERLRARLAERLGNEYAVELGMAYSAPEIPEAVAALEKQGIDELIVMPLFPQFSTATTASVLDDVYSAVSGRSWSTARIDKKNMPQLTFMGAYYDHPGYIQLLAAHLRAYLATLPHAPEQFVLTFHGLPARYSKEGDPYEEQCTTTARLLAEEMGWEEGGWVQAYQSRFGREGWLQPYAEPLIRGLAGNGLSRPCIVPLSFTVDCLETLHELGILYRKTFADGGGNPDAYSVMPCLNDSPAWVDFLAKRILKENI